MSENLSGIVKNLRKELDKLTSIYIDKQHDEATAFMVQSQAIKSQIDELESFVIHQHDKRCTTVLRQKMSKYFDIEETKTLILDYGISVFEDIESSTISATHWELIRFCERREILPELITALKEHRPRVQWPDC